MAEIIFDTKPAVLAEELEQNLRILFEKSPAHGEQTIVIAIGGDGTMLHAIKQHAHLDPLFVGVSAGALGFLQTIEPEEITQLVGALATGEYGIMRAPMLGVRQTGDSVSVYGFNDISIERAAARAAKFTLHIGDSTGRFVGDGVIFSTPLGSTAY